MKTYGAWALFTATSPNRAIFVILLLKTATLRRLARIARPNPLEVMKTFSEFALPPVLATALDEMEFKVPTPIQAQSIPAGMEGRDILAIAPTGTGKTGAFGIPTLNYLYKTPGKQILVLAPTRELAAQIFKFYRKIGEALDLHGTLIVGGESFSRQRTQVKRGVDFIIATPGRLWDHIEQGMPTEHISVLVLDEVDRMLDMGFAPQVEQIVKVLTPPLQTFLFSATMPREIQSLANRYLKNPVRVDVGSRPEDAPKIKEERVDTTDTEKPRLLLDQMNLRTGKVIVFANTQGRVEQVARRLSHGGHPAAHMHGGRTHRERKMALEAFRRGEVRILVATDIAARGIDVTDIEHVINYDYPATEEDYLHRIGRTGRIGKEGSAITFVDPKRMSRGQRRGAQARKPRPQHSAKRAVRGDSRPAKFDRKPKFESRSSSGFSPRPEWKKDRPSVSGPRSPRGGARPDRGDRGDRRERTERRDFRRPAFEKPTYQRPAPATLESVQNLVATSEREGAAALRSASPRPFQRPSKRPFKRHDSDGFRPSFGDRKPRGPRFDDDKPRPRRNVFRAGEDRGTAQPASGPRRAFKGAPDRRSAAERPSKPWIRNAKGGAVRRSKPFAPNA